MLAQTPTASAVTTIGELWQRAAGAGRTRPAFLVEKDGAWSPVGWDEAAERVAALANGFLSLGVEKGDKVAILCRTRLEWSLDRLRALDDRGGRDPRLPDVVAVRDRLHPARLRDEAAAVRGRGAAREDPRPRGRPALARARDRHRRARQRRDAGRRRAGRARVGAGQPRGAGACRRAGRAGRRAHVPLHIGHDGQSEGLPSQPSQLRRDDRRGGCGEAPCSATTTRRCSSCRSRTTSRG